jgi:hypothetical protein
MKLIDHLQIIGLTGLGLAAICSIVYLSLQLGAQL